MKKLLCIPAIFMLYCSSVSAQKYELKTEIDSLSYILGLNIGSDMKQQMQSLPGEKVKMDYLVKGLSDALKEEKALVGTQEGTAFLDNYFGKLQAQEMASQEAAGQENKTMGEAFLANNKLRKGVVTTASGLQYEIIAQGKGKKPGINDQVKVNYRGTLVDGTEFDSSYARNEPIVFGLNQVIPGWTEGLQLMPEGSKWIIYLPYSLAYGTRDMGVIKPYSALIFEVELLQVISTDDNTPAVQEQVQDDQKSDKKKKKK